MLTVFHANDVLILRHSARHNNGLNEGKDCYVPSLGVFSNWMTTLLKTK